MYINFLFLVYLFLFFNAAIGITEEEIRSLLEFKKGIKNDPTGKIGSWSRSTAGPESVSPLNWHGVRVDDDSGSVISIDLQDLGLSGELKFSTLIGLKSLKNLSLAGNEFKGRFVPVLGTMSSLELLDLSRNKFYGPIPGRISELWNLHYLNLSQNHFNGGFPSRLGSLSQLKTLDLHRNELSGDIGELVSELKNVEHVDLSNNKFYGGFDMELDKISSFANTIRHLDLSHNKLNAQFFNEDSVTLFRNLEILDLADNELTGELPSFGSLPALRVFRAGSNMLYGALPEELFLGSIPLEEVDLSRNGFSGSTYDINSTTLKILNLSSNALTGPLPSTLGCSVIDLSGNRLTGDISTLQNWGDALEIIDLSSNVLVGSLPNSTTQYQRLVSIKITNNSLVGALPDQLASSPKLSSIDLSLNNLSGSIAATFVHSTSLTNLNLSGNQLTGTIPAPGSQTTSLLLLHSYPPLESLDLSGNSLTGSLPSSIGTMQSLKVLNLGRNRLSEELPSELSDLSTLERLDLSNNNFKGKLPENLAPSLKDFNVSYNDLSGTVPEDLEHFPLSSFRPGNRLLILPGLIPSPNNDSGGGDLYNPKGKHHSSKGSIRVAIIVASVLASVMVGVVLFAYYRNPFHEKGSSSETAAKAGVFSRPSLFKFQRNSDPPQTSLSFSNAHLLTPNTPNTRSLSGKKDFANESVIAGAESKGVPDNDLPSGWKSSPGSPLSSSPNLIELSEQSAVANMYSPDRLAGDLFFLDNSIIFTAEELSRAPAEVLGRSSHGTLYKATLDSGHMLTVKWLRVGLVKNKKEFARGAKKVGSIRHPNAVSLRAYYWGPREQERLILADYLHGDSLSLHLYETTPRRYSRLSFSQRLKIAVDVTRCLCYLHDRGLTHGNLKPTNVLLSGPELTARLTDYGLHLLMTPAGTAEQLLNLGALGYGAPELASSPKPSPSFKADVYALGVILMELLTRRSAGDIISGQAGAVDLTDWVRLCANEGRGMDCFDRDIAGGEEPTRAMDELLAASLKCILPVNERPSIRTIFDHLSSISP
ncbi:hypothetical protein ACHQM5_022343 [Ranunculus cassubicifolius]